MTKEHEALIKELDNLVQAIKDDLERVTQQLEETQKLIEHQPEMKPLVHAAMASRYHQAVKDLETSLNAEGSRSEASEHLRDLVEKVILSLKEGVKGLRIDLYGDLAGIVNLSTENRDIKSEASRYRIGSGGWI